MPTLAIAVGHQDIDAIHKQLEELALQLAEAEDVEFSSLFEALIEHTEQHFKHEEALMEESGFIHSSEHITEHRQMLGEMRQFSGRRLPIARSYVRQRLSERFALHISRMDSLLAAFLRTL